METVIRAKPRALLIVCRDGKEFFLRCRICYLGFSGEHPIKRACQHIKGFHAKPKRNLIRKQDR
jgi:hypothetical protein